MKFLSDPKTFDELMRRAPWGPWILGGLASVVILIGIWVPVPAGDERADRRSPADERTHRRLLAVASGLIVAAGAGFGAVKSRDMRILARRGRRCVARIAGRSMLSRNGVRPVTLEFEVEGRLVRVRRDFADRDLPDLLEAGVPVLYDPKRPSRMMVLTPEIAALPHGPELPGNQG
jgi:hypothetical protein